MSDSPSTESRDDLADNMRLRPSPYHDASAVTAIKAGVDVCWNCHAPVVHVSQFTDVPMGETYVRICNSTECAKAVIEERRMSLDGATIIEK